MQKDLGIGVKDLKADMEKAFLKGLHLRPPKAAAKAYIAGETATPPPRFAKVTVVRGSIAKPDVMEYKVGPIHGCDVNACDDAVVAEGGTRVRYTRSGCDHVACLGHTGFKWGYVHPCGRCRTWFGGDCSPRPKAGTGGDWGL